MSAVLKEPAARLRPMCEADLPAVVAVEREAYEFPWSQGIFGDCLRVGYCCWVAELEEAPGGHAISGYAIMSVGAGESHILNLCVRPSAQRRGLGRMLLGHMLALARKHHACIAFLEVRPSNHGAIRLYRGAGFNLVGTRRGYYPARHGREDALILSRSL